MRVAGRVSRPGRQGARSELLVPGKRDERRGVRAHRRNQHEQQAQQDRPHRHPVGLEAGALVCTLRRTPSGLPASAGVDEIALRPVTGDLDRAAARDPGAMRRRGGRRLGGLMGRRRSGTSCHTLRWAFRDGGLYARAGGGTCSRLGRNSRRRVGAGRRRRTNRRGRRTNWRGPGGSRLLPFVIAPKCVRVQRSADLGHLTVLFLGAYGVS